MEARKNAGLAGILVVDDSEGDRLIIRHLLSRTKNVFGISDVADIPTAEKYLLGKGNYSDRSQYPLPDLILCDMQILGRSGFALLDFLQSHAELKLIPLAFMSGIVVPNARQTAFERGACAFIDKGDLMHNKSRFIQAILDCLREILGNSNE